MAVHSNCWPLISITPGLRYNIITESDPKDPTFAKSVLPKAELCGVYLY